MPSQSNITIKSKKVRKYIDDILGTGYSNATTDGFKSKKKEEKKYRLRTKNFIKMPGRAMQQQLRLLKKRVPFPKQPKKSSEKEKLSKDLHRLDDAI